MTDSTTLCECGHTQEQHRLSMSTWPCDAIIYNEGVPLGAGAAYSCPCNSFKDRAESNAGAADSHSAGTSSEIGTEALSSPGARPGNAATTPRVVYVPRFAYPLLKRLVFRDRIVYATFYPHRVRVGLRRG